MSTAVPPPDRTDQPDRNAVQPATDADADRTSLSRREVVAREKERFGGMKFGACFFGWLTATGMAVLLTALLAAAGAGLGLATNLEQTTDPADPNQAQTIGLVGGIVLLVIIFLAYVAGGDVAGRRGRVNGGREGGGGWGGGEIIAHAGGERGAGGRQQ